MRIIPASELIINPDGSVFHLHLSPDEVADTIILVGDPARATMVSKYFDTVELSRANREFVSHTGTLNSKRLTVISTGIGCDNIDIVVNELDALFNVDFETRTVKSQIRQLTILRLGTSGGVQGDILIGDYVMSAVSIGIDGLLNFYAGAESVSDIEFEQQFVDQTQWGKRLARPYVIHNNKELIDMFSDFAIKGVTISAGGFYAPQGREVRLSLAQKGYLERIEQFEYNTHRITNIEMESSAIAALSALLGHRALTICGIINQRKAGNSKPDYQLIVQKLIKNALQRLTK